MDRPERQTNPRGYFVGLTTMDYVFYVDSHPRKNSKVKTNHFTRLVGGPAANAAITYSLLGGSETYAASERLNPRRAVEACAAEGRPLPDFWMCCGEQDLLVGDSCSRFRETLLRAGANLAWESGPGEHDLIYWDRHLENAFRFLAGCV